VRAWKDGLKHLSIGFFTKTNVWKHFQIILAQNVIMGIKKGLQINKGQSSLRIAQE